jgi:hypothetical protein
MDSNTNKVAAMRPARLLILASFTLAGIVITFLLPRIPQDRAYHQFADHRLLLGIPNCLNVVSNVPFLLVGVLGLVFLAAPEAWVAGNRFVATQERWPYAVFFLGVALTSLGSAYYHLAPDSERLVWDRLPMTFAFMSFLSATIVERISVKVGLRLLVPLVGFGISSVIYWHLTEIQGKGDLRFYVLAQFYPTLAIPLMMLLFPPRYGRGSDLLVVLGSYAVAKVFESLDKPIFALNRAVSGHALKHVAAAFSTYWLLRMLRLRSSAAKPIQQARCGVNTLDN